MAAIGIRTKHRAMRGIPRTVVAFGSRDANPFAPLHRRLGIETYVHRQAVLAESNGAFGQARGWDPVNRVFSDSHIYRASITLARIA